MLELIINKVRDMKQYMNKVITIAAVLLASASAWAGEVTTIITPNNAGTVQVSQAAAGQTCTITVNPASGYYLTAENLSAVTVISGGVVQAPSRRGIDFSEEKLTITATNPDADPSGETTYTFTMPEDENVNVEVTAEFQTLIAINPSVSLLGWTYGEDPNEPVVTDNLGKGQVTFTYAPQGSANYTTAIPENAGKYTVKASVAAAGKYAAGEATAEFEIGKATLTPAVTLTGWTYGAEANTPSVEGNAGNGTVTYTYKAAGATEFTATVPTAAGTHTVKATIAETANYQGAEATAEFTISAAAITLTKAPAAIANLVYTGEAQALITAGEAVGGELQYKLGDNGTYGTTVPTATAAGTYKVFYKVVAAANYTDLAEASIEVSVAKANPDLEMVNEILTLDAFQTSTTYMNDVKVKLNGNAITGNFTFTYESSNESVATVNANGEVQALGVGEAVIVVRGPIDDANLNEAEVTYNVSVYTTYGITVYKDEKSITIDNTNRNDVFGDATVKYDGRQTLILENAHFAGALDAYITTSNEELKIFLKGENSFNGAAQAILNTKGNGTLTFTTEGNSPGTVTMKNTSGSTTAQVISGFTQIVFEQNLTNLSGSAGQSEMSVGTPIVPFVDDNTEKKAVDVAEAASQAATTLSNTSIEDVLYTLKEESDGTGDKVDATENCVVLASAMVENEVDEAVTTYQPGTDSFAEAFQGLTFMVPAGTGNVIVNVKTGPEGVINVKIGRDEPYVIKNALDFTEYVFPYACSEATYVYIYNASEVRASAPAHRAGRKTSITVGVRTVGVQAIETQVSNAAGVSAAQAAETAESTTPASFEEIEVKEVAGAAVIDNANVITLPNGFFTERAYSNTIDLRGTSISGMVVSRTDGVFKNVSKNTFIYMPTGNSTEESNVVFGKVCDNAVLDAEMPEGESFGPSDAFTAKRIVLDRTFKKNEVATVYLPFDISLNVAVSEFGTFYTFGRAANGFIKIEEVKTNLKANTPYIFKSREDNVRIATRVVRVSMPDESAAAPARRTATEDGLYGCYKHQDAGDGTLFKLVAGETLDDLKFERMTAGDKVLPFQAYLKLNGQEADSFSVTDDEAVVTGIRSIATEQSAASEEWQTLSGVRMQQKPASKGVYIHNGKKIVVK
jgi:hypothetical protein